MIIEAHSEALMLVDALLRSEPKLLPFNTINLHQYINPFLNLKLVVLWSLICIQI